MGVFCGPAIRLDGGYAEPAGLSAEADTPGLFFMQSQRMRGRP